MSLYNMKRLPIEGCFAITKFDDDLNVESNYEYIQGTNGDVCKCPAGERPSCRHRQMFPQLIDRVRCKCSNSINITPNKRVRAKNNSIVMILTRSLESDKHRIKQISRPLYKNGTPQSFFQFQTAYV